MHNCQVSMTSEAKKMLLQGQLKVLAVETNGKATGKVPIDRIIIEQDERMGRPKKIYFCQKGKAIYEVEYYPFSGDLILDDLNMAIDITLEHEDYSSL